MHHIWTWVLHITGSDDVSGKWYGLPGFWSGFAGDLTLLGAVIIYPWVQLRRHNCQMKGCWRIGRHEFTEPDGIKRLLCWKHHPGVHDRQLTREHLHLYAGKHPGRG